MIIGLDKDYNVMTIGMLAGEDIFSYKNIEEQYIDLEMYNYKYVNGKVVNLGLKREFTMTEEEKILEELQELDKTINRATEDLYELTEVTPYKSTQNVINRKIELRNELNLLKKGEV